MSLAAYNRDEKRKAESVIQWTLSQAFLSMQMPKGVPVATVAIGNAANAGLLAIRILASSNAELLQKMLDYQVTCFSMTAKLNIHHFSSSKCFLNVGSLCLIDCNEQSKHAT